MKLENHNDVKNEISRGIKRIIIVVIIFSVYAVFLLILVFISMIITGSDYNSKSFLVVIGFAYGLLGFSFPLGICVYYYPKKALCLISPDIYFQIKKHKEINYGYFLIEYNIDERDMRRNIQQYHKYNIKKIIRYLLEKIKSKREISFREMHRDLELYTTLSVNFMLIIEQALKIRSDLIEN